MDAADAEPVDAPGTRVPHDRLHRAAASIGTVPAGFEIWRYANSNGAGGSLCADHVENKGHTYGSELSSSDKAALIEYLKTL